MCIIWQCIQYCFFEFFDDDFYIGFGIDQHVVEVTTSKHSINSKNKNAQRIQTFVFDHLEKYNLKPRSFYGSGHISLDLKTAFNDDVKLLRNFLVDYLNHPALYHGVFEKDPYNAIGILPQTKSTNSKSQVMKKMLEKQKKLNSAMEKIIKHTHSKKKKEKRKGKKKTAANTKAITSNKQKDHN